jgi:MFS family permease
MSKAFAIPTWLACAIVLAFGYTTGLQLGKVSPYAARLEAEFGYGLAQVGVLTSLLTLFVAVSAAFVGRRVSRIGVTRSLKVSAVVMAIGAVLFGFVPEGGWLLAARTVEALGYVVAVIAAPAYLANAQSGRLRPVFLALWGSVVPIGFAASDTLASQLPASLSLANSFLVFAAPIAVLAMLVLLLRKDVAVPAAAKGDAAPAPSGDAGVAWILAVAFGCYVCLSIAFFAFLPTFAATRSGVSVSSGVVALFVPIGSFAAAFLLSILPRPAVLALAAAGFLGAAFSAPFMFAGASGNALAMITFAFFIGIAASAIIASVSVLTSSRDSSTRTLGAIAQFGGSAVLLGAPLAGFVIERFGWDVLAGGLAAIASLGFLIFLSRLARRRPLATAL